MNDILDHEEEDCGSKYFLKALENLDKQEFSYLLMGVLDEPVETVLKLINKLRMKINEIVNDKVPTVRKFFMEYIPNILVKLKQIDSQPLNEFLYDYLIETIFREFFNEEVIFRQTARKIVLHLLDRGLLTENLVEETVVKILNSHKQEDLPLFMFYLAPLLGAVKTRKYFWEIFVVIVDDQDDKSLYVRKQCVRLIAMFGSILGQEVIENDLLPIYAKLSKASEWGIRKECAVELPKISVLCTKKSREEILTPIVEELLGDLNKWVYSAAIEKLGIFIATFAEPEILTLAINAEGNLYIVNVADDNENYKEMLSEDKLKNFQYYEDLFAETLTPGAAGGMVPIANLVSPFSPFQSSSLSISKTIICDDFERDECRSSEQQRKDGDDNQSSKEENPYQKFVNPKFLFKLSNSYSSPLSPPSSLSTNVDNSSSFQSYGMLLESDLLFTNKNYEQSGEVLETDLCPDPEDPNGNMVENGSSDVSAVDTASNEKEQDTLNNNTDNDNNLQATAEECLDNSTEAAVNNKNIVNTVIATSPASADTNVNNSLILNPLSSVTPEQLTDSIKDESNDDDRVKSEKSCLTSAHLKRATPAGLPMVIKMAIKSKHKGKGLQLSAVTLPLDATHNIGELEEKKTALLEPPETPTIENAPTSCPFGEVKLTEPGSKDDGGGGDFDLQSENKDGATNETEDCDQEFYSNNYWYVKPIELTVDELDTVEKGEASGFPVEKQQALRLGQERHYKSYDDGSMDRDDDELNQDYDQPEPFERRKVFNLNSLKLKSKESRNEMFSSFYNRQNYQQSHIHLVKKSDISPLLQSQTIVPPVLLHFFMEMSHFPEWDQICAYSFPAVVLTLGKQNWHLMRNQLHSLCSAIRWEVRQIIVAAIYQIALIIGRDYASRDLVPIFVSFFKDLDNVKMEALYNVTKFLQVIDKQRHIEVVAHLSECLEPENITNWRFRKDLAHEILKLVELFRSDNAEESNLKAKPVVDSVTTEGEAVSSTSYNNCSVINEECLKYLTGYALRLLMDRVHSVREVAMEAIVSRMRFCNDVQLWDLISILIKAFASSNHWRRRQLFAQLCEKSIEQNAIVPQDFEEKLLPVLIDLSSDKVPNVRLVVAKCLQITIAAHPWLLEESSLKEDLVKAFEKLKCDGDRDVRDATRSREELLLLIQEEQTAAADDTVEKLEEDADDGDGNETDDNPPPVVVESL